MPELTLRQVELIKDIQEISKELGRVPTLEMLRRNPDWPGVGAIRYNFKNYTELLSLAGLPLPRNSKRYRTKSSMVMLKQYILELGRIPSQSEVRANPMLPSDEVYLSLYSSWETVIHKTGFTMSWCSDRLKQKMLDDIWRKYIELGYHLPSLQNIQKDPKMEKVYVYLQVFGDLRTALVLSGVWDDYCEREREEIKSTILRLHKELGRVPIESDPGMPNDKTIRNAYGSYANALRVAGFMPNYQTYTREELVAQLRQKSTALGRSPTAGETDADPEMASIQTFRREFGNYSKALKAARLPPAPFIYAHKYTSEVLIAQLQKKYKQLGRAPTTKEVNSDPAMASSKAFAREFGSHKNALRAAGIPINRGTTKYSRKDLIEQLQRKAEQLGRAPTLIELNADSEMACDDTFVNAFGSYVAALEAAGIRPIRKREYSDKELLDELYKKYLAVGFLETGRRPTNKDINTDPDMASTRAYDVHFGATSEAHRLVKKMFSEGKTATEVLEEKDM